MIIRNGARRHVPTRMSDQMKELLNLPANLVAVNTTTRDIIDEIWDDDDDTL